MQNMLDICRLRNWDFFETKFLKPKLFSETKFSETKTDTFIRDQIFWNWDFFLETKFSETGTFFRDQILWNWNPQKIGKSLETEMSMSKANLRTSFQGLHFFRWKSAELFFIWKSISSPGCKASSWPSTLRWEPQNVKRFVVLLMNREESCSRESAARSTGSPRISAECSLSRFLVMPLEINTWW